MVEFILSLLHLFLSESRKAFFFFFSSAIDFFCLVIDSAICGSSLLVLCSLFVVKITTQCVIMGELCCLLLSLSSQVKHNRPIILSLLVSENEQQVQLQLIMNISISSTSLLSHYFRGGCYALKKQFKKDFYRTVCVHCVILSSRRCEKKSFISSCLLKDLVLTRWIKVPPRSKLPRRLLKMAEHLPGGNFSSVEIGGSVCLETSRTLC